MCCMCVCVSYILISKKMLFKIVEGEGESCDLVCKIDRWFTEFREMPSEIFNNTSTYV